MSVGSTMSCHKTHSSMTHNRGNSMSNNAPMCVVLSLHLVVVADRSGDTDLNGDTDLPGNRVANLSGNLTRVLVWPLLALPLSVCVALGSSDVAVMSVAGFGLPLAVAVSCVATRVHLRVVADHTTRAVVHLLGHVVDTTYVEDCQDIVTEQCHQVSQQVHHSSGVVGHDSQVLPGSYGGHAVGKREAEASFGAIRGHSTGPQCHANTERQCQQRPVQNARQIPRQACHPVPRQVCVPTAREVCVPVEIRVPRQVCYDVEVQHNDHGAGVIGGAAIVGVVGGAGVGIAAGARIGAGYGYAHLALLLEPELEQDM